MISRGLPAPRSKKLKAESKKSQQVEISTFFLFFNSFSALFLTFGNPGQAPGTHFQLRFQLWARRAQELLCGDWRVARRTQFLRHFSDIFCLFGHCFCLKRRLGRPSLRGGGRGQIVVRSSFPWCLLCVLCPALNLSKNSCVFPCLDQAIGKTTIPKITRNSPKSPQGRLIAPNRRLIATNRRLIATNRPKSATNSD